MPRRAWRPRGGIDFGRLREARLQAHHAVQWLARAARAFVPPRPDDGHTNLGWDDALNGFTTHPFRDELSLGLRISDLSLRIIGATAQQSFALDRHTEADARRWLGGRLGAHGMDVSALDAKASYEIPAHAVGRGGAYEAGKLSEPLTELAAWFASAQHALGRTHDQMIARKLAPSPVRTWPHHFDTATLTSLEGGSAEHARSVNVGFSPGDENYDEPYFYVSPHPYPDPRRLAALPSLGHWHVRGFTAAVAPASRMTENADPQAAAEAFLDAAVEAAITALT